MDVESLQISVRPRGTWEAVDLGFRMAREWYPALLRSWWITALPPALLGLLLIQVHSWLPLLALWWFKPLYDRALLHVLGHAVFGDPPEARQIVRALPSLLGAGTLFALTLGRAGTGRAFLLPVRQLENSRGGLRRRRVRILASPARRAPHTVTETCLIMELAVFASLLIVAQWLVPAPVDTSIVELAFSESPPWWIGALTAACYFAAMTLVEPFYVAGSFALYLNHRIVLEGWDIEIAFRRSASGIPAPATEQAA